MDANGCKLCPRACGAVRHALRGNGFCGCGTTPVVARAALHMWEEPVISGTRGSGTVFFSGCTLGCVFCQNYAISAALHGRPAPPDVLAGMIRDLEEQGAHNISFVTGTQYVPAIIEALEMYRPSVPVVWNSGGYESADTLRMLAPYVDIWLPDYKFALSETAEKYAAARDYPETAMAAIQFMCRAAGTAVIENGVMKKGIIVRHLILPRNVRNSVAALRRIRSALPGDTLVSIMSQYTPSGNIADFPELGRRLTEREYRRVCDTADSLEMQGFTQALSSASEAYIPDFDMSPLP